MTLFSFWKGDSVKWQGYKATTILGLCGISKALCDNYWVFKLPLVSDQGDETASKFFYLLFQALLYGTITGAIGLSLDYQRSKYREELSEESFIKMNR